MAMRCLPRATRTCRALGVGMAVSVMVTVSLRPGWTQSLPVPLPAEITVEDPEPGVPPEMARFAGVWGMGAWDGVLPHVLVVEHVRPDGAARVVYAWGDAPDGNIRGGHSRVTGRVKDGVLGLTLRGGRAQVEYRAEGGSLGGTYTIDGRVARVVLLRTTLTEVLKTPAPPRPVASSRVETVRIPMTETGFFGRRRTLTLEGTLYRPSGRGPHPVLVFNHGSTGPGVIPATLTLRHERQAAFFAERGFAVIVPMRRGRGASDGSYAEEQAPGCESRVLNPGLARAVEDLDAVMAWVRQQPWGSTARVMMGGQSRGGILSIVYAAERPDAVRGVINFAGGWTGDGCDGLNNFNEQTFYRAGRRTRIPTLWLYAEEDRYYKPGSIRTYHQAFVRAGGEATLHLVPAFGSDGHYLVNQVSLWQRSVDEFLERLGLASTGESK